MRTVLNEDYLHNIAKLWIRLYLGGMTMDLEALDSDHFVRRDAYTPHVYRDVYPSIDPASPALSQEGKVVIITGAAGGVSADGLAPAFARAGARAIVLVGRNRDSLAMTAMRVQKDFPSIKTLVAPGDVSDPDAVEAIFDAVEANYGYADVLINNAATLPGHLELINTDPTAWWKSFEVNLRGTYLMTRKFLLLLGRERRGSIINVTTGAAVSVVHGDASYGLAKFAVNRLTEYIAMEQKNVVCVTLDPGMVDTGIVPSKFRKFARDTPQLVGGAAVWLATEPASFLTGRLFKCNWSVDDMLGRKSQILASDDLRLGMQGKFGMNNQSP